MSKLMDSYCQRNGITRTSVRFIYDGERIQDQQTAKELQMEDGDSIDAVLEQVGGS